MSEPNNQVKVEALINDAELSRANELMNQSVWFDDHTAEVVDLFLKAIAEIGRLRTKVCELEERLQNDTPHQGLAR